MTFIQVWNVNEVVDIKVDKRNWIKMQNVDEIKELKILILKDECLKEQSQSSDDDDCNWFRRLSSIKIIKSWWLQF